MLRWKVGLAHADLLVGGLVVAAAGLVGGVAVVSCCVPYPRHSGRDLEEKRTYVSRQYRVYGFFCSVFELCVLLIFEMMRCEPYIYHKASGVRTMCGGSNCKWPGKLLKPR